jgi:hypothetical protein
MMIGEQMLPNEILVEIFLASIEKTSCIGVLACVCRTWKDIVNRDSFYVKAMVAIEGSVCSALLKAITRNCADLLEPILGLETDPVKRSNLMHRSIPSLMHTACLCGHSEVFRELLRLDNDTVWIPISLLRLAESNERVLLGHPKRWTWLDALVEGATRPCFKKRNDEDEERCRIDVVRQILAAVGGTKVGPYLVATIDPVRVKYKFEHLYEELKSAKEKLDAKLT